MHKAGESRPTFRPGCRKVRDQQINAGMLDLILCAQSCRLMQVFLDWFFRQ